MNHFDLAATLLAVVEAGSIQQAANRLNQTNAAISKKISRLEKHLGIKVIERDRKGVTLTEAGQRYHQEIKQAIEQLTTAELAAKQSSKNPTGKLKVVCNQFYAEKYLLPKLKKFSQQYPDLLLQIEIAEILPDFNAQKMDILLGVSVPGQDHLVQKKIEQTRYVLCAAPNYLQRYGTPKTVNELLLHNFIGHSARKPNNLIRLNNKEVTIKPKLFLNNSHLLAEVAAAGIGIIWTHENLVQDYLKQKKLVTLLDKATQGSVNVFTYYAHQKYHDAKIQAFMKFFLT